MCTTHDLTDMPQVAFPEPFRTYPAPDAVHRRVHLEKAEFGGHHVSASSARRPR
jgi:hypothetical protein